MKRTSLLLALMIAAAAPALAKVQVVSSLQDFSSIAQSVGGDRVETFALAKGYPDPHFVDAKPSFILKLSRADVLIVAAPAPKFGYLTPPISQAPKHTTTPPHPTYLERPIARQILHRPHCDG